MLSLFGGGALGAVVGTQVDGVPHFLSRDAAAVLRSVAPEFDCVWCTGWEERADEHLPALLDLPRGWPCVRFTDPPTLDLHWKLSAIDAFAGSARALAWIDDGHDAGCREWAAARPGPTLLVTTLPDEGLTAAHAETLRAWAQQLR